jgi:hypothetical protein
VCVVTGGDRAQVKVSHPPTLALCPPCAAKLWLDCPRCTVHALVALRGMDTLLNDVEPLLPPDGGIEVALKLPMPEGGSLLPVLQCGLLPPGPRGDSLLPVLQAQQQDAPAAVADEQPTAAVDEQPTAVADEQQAVVAAEQ